MTNQKIISIDGGSAEYWRQRKLGFRLIREADQAANRLAEAPMYLHGGYDEDGDVIPIENLQPYDDLEEAIRAIEENKTAVSILVAQRCTEIGNCPINAVIRALRQQDEPIEDPVSNPLWGPDTD
ncbi:hypothetical protein QEZ48_16690 [Aquamicrobium lusatiense]|uniref:hypothetical protein n=1 Tax=Aquamicrobium lusatiense TaxID=89772 RepID=UPI002455AA30|nr:hypothetical protein [Aquamicrobium lusatiense]MDH4992450.1 hypothetical protein [Aquamicrobium lusatiense]